MVVSLCFLIDTIQMFCILTYIYIIIENKMLPARPEERKKNNFRMACDDWMMSLV